MNTIDIIILYGQGYYNQPTEKVASGSGVIISKDGYVVTNKHVINEAEEIEVVLNDKRSYSRIVRYRSQY